MEKVQNIDKNITKIGNRFDIGKVYTASRFGNGLINDTYLVTTADRKKYILQKLHTILKPSLLDDIYAITTYLSKNRFLIPTLIKTSNGSFYVSENGRYWRMLNFIRGKSFEKGVNPDLAFNAAALVGKFHAILSNCEYEFQHKIPDFHNTPAKISELKNTLNKFNGTKKYKILHPLANFVIHAYEKMNKKIDALPDRIIHGDLKINNVRFDNKGKKAISILDLDTMARHKIIIDFGDAARTWCNRADEDNFKKSVFDIGVFNKMLTGYLSTAKMFITPEEIIAIPEGIETIILELSARFLTDAFEETYFGWNPKRYPSRFEHNKARVLAQLKLYKDFQNKKQIIIRIITDSNRQIFKK